MTYTPPVYPSAIPTQTSPGGDLPDRIDDIDWLVAARYNELKKELCAIMTELGTLPKGASADVKARLATLAVNPMSAAGDMIIGGTAGAPARLAVGAANLKLFMNAAGNAPEFAAGMKIGTFTRAMVDGAGTQAITGVGFKPSSVIFLSAINGGAGQNSIGLDNGTVHYVLQNRYAVIPGSYIIRTDGSIYIQTDYWGSITALGSDGFTITWSQDPGTWYGSIVTVFLAFR